LSGIQRKLLKVSFWNVQQLNEAKREIAPIVARNRAKSKTTAAYTDLHRRSGGADGGGAMAVQVRRPAAQGYGDRAGAALESEGLESDLSPIQPWGECDDFVSRGMV